MLETDSGKTCAGALNQWESEGNRLTKWEVLRVIKQLRKFKHFKRALEVFEWMTDQEDRFIVSSSDTAVQLDLVAKVHGISGAEDYFLKLPDTVKDKRIYGALLNAYVQTKMRDKAESLMAQMMEMGYGNHTLPFNVMMTLYMKLKDYDTVESTVSLMMDKNIPLDLYSYNIWLSSLGYQGSAEKMEQVAEQMNMDTNVNANWSTFTTMATMYIKFGRLEKAEECLKMVESRLTGRNRLPYHYLISLYAGTGNKQEIQRIWNNYRTVFSYIPNLAYHMVISAFTKLGEIEEAENTYEEWLSVKEIFDCRICNQLLSWYVRNGFLDKAKALFSEIDEHGGKLISNTWELLAEVYIAERRAPEAVSCLEKSVTAVGSKFWKPKPANVSAITKLCEEEGDEGSREILLGVMREAGCFEDEGYMSYIPMSIRVATRKDLAIAEGRTDVYEVEEEDDHDDGAEVLRS